MSLFFTVLILISVFAGGKNSQHVLMAKHINTVRKVVSSISPKPSSTPISELFVTKASAETKSIDISPVNSQKQNLNNNPDSSTPSPSEQEVSVTSPYQPAPHPSVSPVPVETPTPTPTEYNTVPIGSPNPIPFPTPFPFNNQPCGGSGNQLNSDCIDSQ